MSADGMKFTIDTSNWKKLTDKLEKGISVKAGSGLYMLLETKGKKMENYARNRSIWQNQTGDARRRLLGGAMSDNSSVSAFVAHGVWYGVFLELAHGRKYAILEQSVKAYKTETIRAIVDYLGKIQ